MTRGISAFAALAVSAGAAFGMGTAHAEPTPPEPRSRDTNEHQQNPLRHRDHPGDPRGGGGMSKTWINKGDYVVTRKGLADPFYGMVTKVCSDFYVRVLNHTTRQEHDYDACDFKIVKAASETTDQASLRHLDKISGAWVWPPASLN
jgi:hypothetical protein